MNEKAALWAMVFGRVQGVYFRAFVEQHALTLGLEGYVHNLPGGRSVEVHAEGDREALEALVKVLNIGPTGARVDSLDTHWSEYSGRFTDFQVRY